MSVCVRERNEDKHFVLPRMYKPFQTRPTNVTKHHHPFGAFLRPTSTHEMDGYVCVCIRVSASVGHRTAASTHHTTHTTHTHTAPPHTRTHAHAHTRTRTHTHTIWRKFAAVSVVAETRSSRSGSGSPMKVCVRVCVCVCV